MIILQADILYLAAHGSTSQWALEITKKSEPYMINCKRNRKNYVFVYFFSLLYIYNIYFTFEGKLIDLRQIFDTLSQCLDNVHNIFNIFFFCCSWNLWSRSNANFRFRFWFFSYQYFLQHPFLLLQQENVSVIILYLIFNNVCTCWLRNFAKFIWEFSKLDVSPRCFIETIKIIGNFHWEETHHNSFQVCIPSKLTFFINIHRWKNYYISFGIAQKHL